ncbi:MAG: hypothetical protein EXR35_06465 [Limnohabitans sp.]|nr:hypothetical protein [Limnohabitans sp.]
MKLRWPMATCRTRRGLGLVVAKHDFHLVELSAMAHQAVQFCTHWKQAFDKSEGPPSLLKKARQHSGALGKRVVIGIDDSSLHYRQIQLSPGLSTQDRSILADDMYWDHQCNLVRDEFQGKQKFIATEIAHVMMGTKNQI